ncbi:MAG: hypothetical protein IJH39_12510 [Clostridia bacterium]|nr:hypothetical protein [Clostridia bacterium]
MDEYIDIINKTLNDVEEIKLISKTNNIVFKVKSRQYGVVYAKFYLNKSSHIDNEIKLYDFVNNKYLKEIITKSYSFAIFKELKGKTVDELSESELSNNKEYIVESLIDFFETISKKKIQGFGLLDSNLNGTSKDFKEFIVKRQLSTQNELKDYPFLNNIFSKIYEKYSDLIVEDNCLVPIDTNMKNIMLTEQNEIKFIDPGELISAPILMGYGDFVAHTYKTELYNCLMEKLKLNGKDEKRLRIYAIFSSLNVLAFIKRAGGNELDKVIPYGNKYTFYDLIKEHLEKLEIFKKDRPS